MPGALTTSNRIVMSLPLGEVQSEELTILEQQQNRRVMSALHQACKDTATGLTIAGQVVPLLKHALEHSAIGPRTSTLIVQIL